jgi:plastocyanin
LPQRGHPVAFFIWRISVRRSLSLCLSVMILCATLSSVTHAATVIVSVANFAFSPQTTNIDPGDTVTFINAGGFHNVVADDNSFVCAHGCDGDGHGGDGSPSSANWIASVTFNQAGTFGYYCQIHGKPGEGMFGTVIVQGAPPPPPPPPSPPPATVEVPAFSGILLALLACAIGAAALRFFLRLGRDGR